MMEPICLKILEEWAKYTNYDENQTRFTLGTYDITLHSATKKIKHVIEGYDETGMISVIMMKELFYDMLKDSRSKIPAYDLLMNPTMFDDTRHMHELFNSKEFLEMESQYTTTLNALINKVIGKKLLPDNDSNPEESIASKILKHTDKVVNALDKCHVEVYKKSGLPVENIEHFSTKINIFPTLATCLLALDKAPDGLYLCYIDIHQSADSYFGFFLKSNGNLLSFNERVNEAYRGQHASGRNARWTEGKADAIFPYDFIFNYDGYDYKGYATAYAIDESKLSFFELTEDVYLPLLIGMIFTAKKFNGKTLDEYPLFYTDALLKVNMPLLTGDKNELMVIEKNELVAQTNQLDLSFDYNKLMNGEIFDEFKENRAITSLNNGQIFVDLYGEGFMPQSAMNVGQFLLETKSEYVAEVVSTETGMRAQACMDIRKQLSAYIKQKMFEEYQAFGGADAVQKWFVELCESNIDKLKDFAVQAYIDVKRKKRHGSCGTSTCIPHGDYGVSIEEGRVVDCSDWGCCILNKGKDKYPWRWYDFDTDAMCNIKVSIFPSDYVAIEKIFGVEVPKIVKGWQRIPDGCSTNSNLCKYDDVERVYSPFCRYGYNANETYKKDNADSVKFGFTICFAKRGLKMNAKRLGYDIDNLEPVPEEEQCSKSVCVRVL